MGLWMIQSIRRELNGVSYVAGKEEHSSSEEPSAQEVELPAFKGATHEMGFGDLIEEAKQRSISRRVSTLMTIAFWRLIR